ncbi:hypothetical protein B0H14DRAFT_3688185 [Mycena olivaceomarginata]|nr:hypothetical protein B0H14DRAFT_3688185 [Mycena olivaceomarginata]
MATVHPQQPLPHHRDVLKKVPLNAPRQSAYSVPPPQPQPTATNPFYGYEYIAQLSARFITHLFACPPSPPQSTHSQAKLPCFIAYALHRTKLHQAVTYATLVLLQRLKAHFPTARGSSGHRLFISAFMIASKVICDDTARCVTTSIGNVDDPILANFEAMVQRDFPPNSKGPYPMYSLHMVSKRAAKAAASTSATPHPRTRLHDEPHPGIWPAAPSDATQAYPPPPPPILAPPLYKKSTPPMTPDTPSHIHSNTTLARLVDFATDADRTRGPQRQDP